MVRAELAVAAIREHLGILTSDREDEPELAFTAFEVSMLARVNPERPAGASSPEPLPQLGALALTLCCLLRFPRALLTGTPSPCSLDPSRSYHSPYLGPEQGDTPLSPLSQPLGHLFLLTENENSPQTLSFLSSQAAEGLLMLT